MWKIVIWSFFLIFLNILFYLFLLISLYCKILIKTKIETWKMHLFFKSVITLFLKNSHITTSCGPGKRSMSPPGCRPPFLKPKFHKKSKYGFKPISFRSPMGVIFSNYFFGAKNCQKNWTFCWFLKFYLNICAQVRPVLKNLISGLPGSVEKLQKYWKLHYFFMRYFYCLKHHKSGEMWPFVDFSIFVPINVHK